MRFVALALDEQPLHRFCFLASFLLRVYCLALLNRLPQFSPPSLNLSHIRRRKAQAQVDRSGLVA